MKQMDKNEIDGANEIAIGGVSYHDIIDCLSGALEAKDEYTKGHASRVADMVCDVCQILGIKGSVYQQMHMAAHMHDIGKIGVPDEVLSKSDKLTDREWNLIRQHPTIGYNILMKAPSLEVIAKMILHHHERYDGTGYPSRLKARQIPFAARVIGICDAIDAMTSNRPYRKAMSWKVCKDIVERNSGSQFDPQLVVAIDSLWEIWQKRDRDLIEHKYRE